MKLENSFKKTTLKQPPFLVESLDKLEIGQHLRKFMDQKGYTCIKQLVDIGGPALLKLEGFSYLCLYDLLKVLDTYGDISLLSEK